MSQIADLERARFFVASGGPCFEPGLDAPANRMRPLCFPVRRLLHLGRLSQSLQNLGGIGHLESH